MKNQKKEHASKPEPRKTKQPIFYENPYDIETFIEGCRIAAAENREFQFIDRVLTHMRIDPLQEVSTVVFTVLTKDLELMKFEERNY
jgi:hypothetical protein